MNSAASPDEYPAPPVLKAAAGRTPEAILPRGKVAANESVQPASARRTIWNSSRSAPVQSITSSGAGLSAPIFGTPVTESIMTGIIEPDTVEFSRAYQFAKRLLDIFSAAVGLIILSPVFLIVAFLVLLDSSGPVFFMQERAGFRGWPFRMLKFRTMAPGESLPQERGLHKRRDDHRVTRVGKFLRATSLDELPQLVNVLRGEMSLVGPRPEILSIVSGKYQPWQYQRFLVPQGMTGWWQVTGRGRKLLYEHTEDDLYYIEHASFWFDLKILLMTIQAVIRREGAF